MKIKKKKKDSGEIKQRLWKFITFIEKKCFFAFSPFLFLLFTTAP